MKEQIPIREPKKCIEPGCVQPAKKRERCLKRYHRLRYWEMKNGTWEPLPKGNFGDPEGHTISAKMGGAKRAEDREGLREAGRIGARRFEEKHSGLRSAIGKLGGAKTAANREHMREIGRRGIETQRRKREKKGTQDGQANL